MSAMISMEAASRVGQRGDAAAPAPVRGTPVAVTAEWATAGAHPPPLQWVPNQPHGGGGLRESYMEPSSAGGAEGGGLLPPRHPASLAAPDGGWGAGAGHVPKVFAPP